MATRMSDVVCELGDCTISRADLVILQTEGSWLNDNVITFYFESVEQQAPTRPSNVVVLQPSAAFMLRLLPPDELTGTVGTKANPFIESTTPKKRFVVVPINDAQDPFSAGGSHWSLLVLDKYLGTATHYDSSLGHNRRAALETCHCLGKLLGMENIKFEEPKCFQQTNSHDCGVFLLLNFRSVVLKHPIAVNRDAAIEFRKELLEMVLQESQLQNRH